MAFRFKLIPFVATVLVVALGVQLGNWQQRRAEQKIALQAKLARARAAPVALDGAPVAADAGLPPRHRQRRIRARLAGLSGQPAISGQGRVLPADAVQNAGSNMHVLVARGWLPRDPAVRDRLPTTPRRKARSHCRAWRA
jgi:cytochrome oxidase assembly protein ShyY1